MKSKEYIRPMPSNWWMHNRHLVQFMIRELTAIFVAGYAIFLLIILYQSNGKADDFKFFFENVMANKLVIGLQLLALVFVLFHSFTSFNAAPVMMVVWRGDEKLDPRLIIAGNYAAWLVVSLLILVFVL